MKTHSTQIVFVSPDGTETDGPLLLQSEKKIRARRLNHSEWDQACAVRRFCRYLQNRDDDGLRATMSALDRLDCWPLAVDQLLIGRSPNVAKGCALLSFWNNYGLYSIPRGLKENLPHLVDAFKYLLPPYKGESIILYRGELASRQRAGVYGISWTPKIETAKVFADRRWPDEGAGVVLGIEATPTIIVAAVKDYSQHTLTLGEDEYLVDPQLIEGKVSVVDDRLLSGGDE